jgi:hypothetical protein
LGINHSRAAQTAPASAPAIASLRNYLTTVFSEAWATAIADFREDYSNTPCPEEWEFSLEVEALLSEKFWEPKISKF